MSAETSSAVGLYPQAKLRIQAAYHQGSVGDAVPAGQPETVDIEINEPYGQGGEAIAFITALVDSLFRVPGRQYDITLYQPGARTSTSAAPAVTR